MIDLTKPVKTVDGRSVRILCTDLKHTLYPVAAAIMSSDGVETVEGYTAEGKYLRVGSSPHYLDLVNVPVTTYGYLPLPDKADAFTYTEMQRWLEPQPSCIEVTFEDGKAVSTRVITLL